MLIERNHFLNANGPGDSAGAHIDFNCRKVIVQYNFSANNAGHRVKGENAAFQEGKTFWLSGYRGKNEKRKGPFNSYFYNNTIFVTEDIVSKVAVDKAAPGVLLIKKQEIWAYQGGLNSGTSG